MSQPPTRGNKSLFMEIKFKNVACNIHKGTYTRTGRISLHLTDARNIPIIAPTVMCTINLPEEYLSPPEVIVNDEGENKGIYKALLQAGIISPYKRRLQNKDYLVCDYIFD